jgi:hypothetical protein
MRRAAPRRKSSSDSTPPGPAAGHCRALVLVDGTAIRKKIKQDYEKALRGLESARRELSRFQEADVPQFSRWLNSQFGASLTELRELSQKISANEDLIFQVENEVVFGAGSHARAYQRVMDFRENPPAPAPEFDGNHHNGAGPEFGGNPFAGEAEAFAEFLNEAFGDFPPDDGTDGNPFEPAFGARAATPAANSVRVKDLYRKLVRLLHPDTQAEMTAQKTEWWHQAQAAYDAGDAEQLEVILTLCEIGASGTTATTTASLLHRITAQLKRTLREIKRQLRSHRKELAWNFSVRTDRETLAQRLRLEMTRDLKEMRRHWQETVDLINHWKADAARLQKSAPQKRRREPRNRQPQDMEFPF